MADKTNDPKPDFEVEPPPDGGYGWVIVFASWIVFVFTNGIVWSMGNFYDIFRESLEASHKQVTLIFSLMTGFLHLIGPVTR